MDIYRCGDIFAMHGRKDLAHTITFFSSISMFTADSRFLATGSFSLEGFEIYECGYEIY